jgi:hypothetical protein
MTMHRCVWRPPSTPRSPLRASGSSACRHVWGCRAVRLPAPRVRLPQRPTCYMRCTSRALRWRTSYRCAALLCAASSSAPTPSASVFAWRKPLAQRREPMWRMLNPPNFAGHLQTALYKLVVKYGDQLPRAIEGKAPKEHAALLSAMLAFSG